MRKIETFTNDVNNFVGSIKNFVLNVLEYSCDEQLFEQVRVIQGEASPGRSLYSVVIGERLLVLLGDYDRLDPFEYEMPRLLLAGITYRDSIGLKQVMIILPETVPIARRDLVDSELSKIGDRIQVHYVS